MSVSKHLARAKIQEVVRMHAYKIVVRAVEEGVQMGVSRAHKHTERPSRSEIEEHVEREVLLALSDVLDFPDA